MTFACPRCPGTDLSICLSNQLSLCVLCKDCLVSFVQDSCHVGQQHMYSCHKNTFEKLCSFYSASAPNPKVVFAWLLAPACDC